MSGGGLSPFSFIGGFMSVTATFGGQTYTFPDGTSDEDIYKALNDSVGRYGTNNPEGYESNPLLSQETKDNYWGIYKEGQDGSILDTAGKNLSSMVENVIAANIEDPTLSNYARRRAKAANAEYQKESAKLGVAGNVISGAAAYAPIIAGGVAGSLINPVAGAAALGTLGGGAAYADALREQQNTLGEYDNEDAALAGIATGAADVALMGLGSRLRGGAQIIGKALPVASPTRAVAAALTEDVGSSAAGTVFSNMASGKPWNENLGEAALIGGTAGAGVRGSLHGLSKALELPLNSRGEKAINDSVEVNNWTGGRKPSETLQRDYAEYENTLGGLQERLANSSDPAESKEISDALSNASEDYSHISAISKMTKLLKDGKAHLIDSFYDIDIPTKDGSFNVGVDGLGLTKDEMLRSREIIGESKPTMTSNRKAKEEGITSDSFNEKAQDAGSKILKDARGKINQNKVLIEQAYRKAHQADPSSQTTKNLKDLLGIYSGYTKDIHAADSGTKSVDTLFGAQVASRNIIDLATKTGLYRDMVDVTGQKGALDPLGDYKAILGIADGLLSQDKRFRQGIHDPTGETSKSLKLAEKYGPGGGIAGAGLVGAGLIHPAVLPIATAGLAIHEGIGRFKQSKGRKAIESAQANLANLAAIPRTKKAVGDAKVKAGVDSGNMELASRGAAESIEAQGFKPIEPISDQAKSKEAVIDDAATAVKVEAIPEVVSNVRQPSPLPRKQPVVKAVEEPAAIPVEEIPAVQSNVTPIQPKPKKSRKQTREERRSQRTEPVMEQPVVEAVPEVSPIARTSAVEGARAPTKPTPKVEEQTAPEVTTEPVETHTRSALPKPPRESSRARKKRIREENKAAEKARVKEETPVVEEIPVKETPQRTSATEQARKPTKPETKVEEAPVVESTTEAPITRSKATEMAEKPTTPTKEESAPEATTEALKATEETKVVEEVETPKETKKSSIEMVRKPLEKKVEELSSVPLKNRSVDLVMRLDEAKKDLNLITSITDKLANRFKIPHEKIAGYIEDMGGFEAAKKANRDAQHKDANLQQFIGNYVRDRQEASSKIAKESLKNVGDKIQEKVDSRKPKVSDEEAKNAKVDFAKKQLEAAGFSPEIIKAASDKYDDPRLITTHARALEKERLAGIKSDLEDSKKKSKEAVDKVNSKEHIREYLDGMKVSGDPELEGLFEKVFKHRGDKPITDNQRITLLNKIDEYLNNQKVAYEGLVKKGGADTPEHKAKAATYASMQKTLQDNIKKVDAERAEAKAALAKSVKEQEDLEKMYDKMFVEGEKRAKIVENKRELGNQIEDMIDSLKALGAPDNYIQKYVHNAFIKHETALKPEQLNKIRAKAVNDLIEENKKVTKELKKEIAPEIKKLDDDQLEKASTSHMLNIDSVKSTTDPKYDAVTEVIEEELSSRGMRDVAEELKTFRDILQKAEERKQLLPGEENKDYWLSAEDFAALQDKINKGSGSSYMGNLGVKLRLHLFDDRNAEKHVRFSNNKIEQKLKGRDIDEDVIIR